MSSQPTVFISYSHEDEDEKEALLTHLSVLATEGLIDVWSDDQIEAGATRQREVAEAIAGAGVAILLITANYLASDFIVGEQIPKLLQRRQNEGLTIFPVIAKACAWDAVSWLKQMDVRPKHGRPVWREGGRYAQEDLATIVGEVERIFRKSAADSQTDEWVGTFLGRYQLLSFLGQGSSMARVYETFHSGLNLRMAIKVMDSSRMSDSALERFQDEATAVARLHHNHIVRVYDFDQAKGKHYMVMDLISGPTLENKLAERRFSSRPFALTEAVDIIEALANALDYAHAEGVVHHDLKPANIMFTTNDEKGRLLLTDFGIARIMGASNQTIPGMFLGTPNYASPEQAQGQRGDKRSDIYSVGVILYEMVTGRLPFEGDTSQAVMRKHINQPVPPPTQINPNLPPAVEQVILKALQKNPVDRYQTAGELAEALKKTLDKKVSPLPVENDTEQPELKEESTSPEPKIFKLGQTVDLFNQGCSSFQRAIQTKIAGNFSEAETALISAARDVVDSLEWALKVYLNNIPKLAGEDRRRLGRPNFHDLISLMKKYADPPLTEEMSRQMYGFRDMRNQATHIGGIPPVEEVRSAIEGVRQFLLAYLSVEESRLLSASIKGSVDEDQPKRKDGFSLKTDTDAAKHTPQSAINISELRSRLNRLLDDAEFDAFCLDNFPQVYDRFSRGMRKDEKITMLLDYCRRDSARLRKLSNTLQMRIQSEEENFSINASKPPQLTSEYTYDLFISHNKVDHAWVQGELYPRLEAAGLRIMDSRDFVPGDSLRKNIRLAVKNSKHTLIILTPDFVKDGWDSLAAEIAATLDPIAVQRKLLPLLLQVCQLPETITDLNLVYLDFTAKGNWNREFERLIRAIKSPL